MNQHDGIKYFIYLTQAPKDWPKSHVEIAKSKCCLSQGHVSQRNLTMLPSQSLYIYFPPDYWAGFTLLLPSLITWIELGDSGIHPATSQTKFLLSKGCSLHTSHMFDHQDVSNGSSHCQDSVEAGSLCQTTGGGKLLNGCWGHVPLSSIIILFTLESCWLFHHQHSSTACWQVYFLRIWIPGYFMLGTSK